MVGFGLQNKLQVTGASKCLGVLNQGGFPSLLQDAQVGIHTLPCFQLREPLGRLLHPTLNGVAWASGVPIKL